MTALLKRRLFWIFFALLILLVAFFFAAGRLLVVNGPQHSDVIVALAGETHYRPELAIQLLNQGYGHRLVIDVESAARIFDRTDLDLAREYVHRQPQAASITICPIDGLSTKEESHDVEKCLAGEPASKILLVTSDYHTRRALSIFQHEIHGKSFSVAAAHDPTEFGTQWWTHRQWAKTCVNEWFRMIWWQAVDRWI